MVLQFSTLLKIMERTDVINVSASMEHELQEREFVYRVTTFSLFLSLTVHYFYIRNCAIIIRRWGGGGLKN